MRSKGMLEAILSKADAGLKVFQGGECRFSTPEGYKTSWTWTWSGINPASWNYMWLPNVAASGCARTSHTQTPAPSLIPFPCQKVEIGGIKSQIKFRDIKTCVCCSSWSNSGCEWVMRDQWEIKLSGLFYSGIELFCFHVIILCVW